MGGGFVFQYLIELVVISFDHHMSDWIWTGYVHAQPSSPLAISRHTRSYQSIRIGFRYNRLASIMNEEVLLLDVDRENSYIVMQVRHGGNLTCFGWHGSANLIPAKLGSLDVHGSYD